MQDFYGQRVTQRELVEINEFIYRTCIQLLVSREIKNFHANGLIVLPTAEENPKHAPCTVFGSCFKPSRQIIPDINLSGTISLQSL